MSLLLLFAYPNPLSVPISELVTTAPSASNGFVIQRPASSGEWRFVLELADPGDGSAALWRDASDYYAGDRHQFGADDYLGKARARLVTVQLQIDDSDLLAPWGQDTSSIFGTDVRLDAGMLMRASLVRIVSGVVVEWEPLWTGRVESWGDASEARGQVRKHIVSVVDTISDLAKVPTFIGGEDSTTIATWFTERVLPAAGWLFGVDIYGDVTDPGGLPGDQLSTAAINRVDQGTEPLGLVWRSLRSGRMVIHPAPWDTTNTDRYDNPLLDVYPDGLRFNWSPDTTDIDYIADDDQQPFGIQRTNAGIINSIAISYPDGFDTAVYQTDDPVSAGRYGVRPYSASWIVVGDLPQTADDILDARAYANAQALPLRTTLDHEGFWSAMAIVDHMDPVTIIHATHDAGLVVTATGTIRNIVEERTYRGDGLLNWQSTVQIDIDATETSAALLPVELLALESTSTGSSGPASAEFSWVNPTQPDITPTEVQLRLLGRSPVWYSKDYPGVGADGTTIGFLEPATAYTLQVRLIRRVNGVVTAFSAIRSVEFTTAARIWPIPIPGDTPDETQVDGDIPDECPDLEVELQENDGSGWVTVDTFTGAELTDNGDGTFILTTPIDNSFFNDGSMYRFRSSCDGVDWNTGTPFDPPDDWSDPCTTPPALSDPPYNDASLLVYVPQICAPDIIREAVSGIAGVHGDALEAIVSGVGDPEERALLAIADPAWSDAAGGILAYGECPQIVGETGDKTISIRVMLADDSVAVVLGECAGMTLGVAPTGGGVRFVATVYTSGVTTTLPSTSVFPTSATPYLVTATFEYATGTINLLVDDVTEGTVGGTDNVGTINALPIWRVGAPPESWITDFALWLGTPAGGGGAIDALNPTDWWIAAESIVSGGNLVSAPSHIPGGASLVKDGTPPITMTTLGGAVAWNFASGPHALTAALGHTITQPFTILVACAVPNHSPATAPVMVYGSGGPHVFRYMTNFAAANAPAGSTMSATGEGDNGTHVHWVEYNGASSRSFIDGVLVGSASLPSTAFGSSIWVGDIAGLSAGMAGPASEVVIIEGVKSDALRDAAIAEMMASVGL